MLDSVNVSCFAYVPLCRASTALTSWLYWRDTASLETGPFQVRRFSGDAEPPTLLNDEPVAAELVARACSGCGRLKAPLTRWPVATVLASCTVSNASLAVEITFAEVPARYVFVTHGVNSPKLAGAPRVSESVAGTVPPTDVVASAGGVASAITVPGGEPQLAVSEEGPLPETRVRDREQEPSVVDSMNVSCFAYAPARRASFAPMLWLNRRVTGSSATGAPYVRSVSGEAAPPTLLNAVPVAAELVARALAIAAG